MFVVTVSQHQAISPYSVCWYLVSAGVALEAQAGDRGFVCHSDPSGGAGVPQVVMVDLPLSGSHHQTGAVQSEVHRGQWTVHPDGPQDTGDTNAHIIHLIHTHKTVFDYYIYILTNILIYTIQCYMSL